VWVLLLVFLLEEDGNDENKLLVAWSVELCKVDVEVEVEVEVEVDGIELGGVRSSSSFDSFLFLPSSIAIVKVALELSRIASSS